MNENRRRLLFIEPRDRPTLDPVVDSITRKMCSAFRQARNSDYASGGVHRCCCGAYSSCCDHLLPDGTVTNSLCVHYVAHHRRCVPADELSFIGCFEWGESDPNEDELKGPKLILASTRAMVERSFGETAGQMWQRWGLDIDELASALLSLDPVARKGAEELFELLCFFSHHLSPFLGVLKRLGFKPTQWGADALRLPKWDRGMWLPPMLELLRSHALQGTVARGIGFHFRCLRTDLTVVPEELVSLSRTASGDLRTAAILAVNGLSQE